MATNLLIFGGIALGYILIAILCFNYIIQIKDDQKRQTAHKIFNVINVIILGGALVYAYIQLPTL